MTFERWVQVSKYYTVPLLALAIAVISQFREVLKPNLCRNYTFATYGDGLNTIWNNFILTKQGFPPWQQSTNWVNFPVGEPFWTSDWWSSIIPRMILYSSSEIWGPICGYNLTAFLGVLLTSCVAYCLVFQITRSVFIGIISSITLTFGPYLTAAIPEHIHKTFLWGLLLVLLLSFRSIERPNMCRLSVLGFVSGIMSYIDGYFTIMIFIIVATFTASLLLRRNSNKSLGSNLTFWKALIPLIYLIVFQIPNILAITLNSPQTFYELRSAQSIDIYRLRLWHLFIPSYSNPYLPSFIQGYITRNIGGTNVAEIAVYLTWTFFLFSLFALTQISRITIDTHGSIISRVVRKTNYRMEPSLLMLILITLIALFISFSSSIWKVLFTILPFFRTISRFGLLLDVSIICLGAIGMHVAFSRIAKMGFRYAAKLGVCLILTLELGIPGLQNLEIVDFQKVVPQGYFWIRENTNPDSVILDFKRWSPGSSHLGYGLIHQRKVANPWRPSSIVLTEKFYDAGESGLYCFLSEHEVDYIVAGMDFPIPSELYDSRILKVVYQDATIKSNEFVKDVEVFKVDKIKVAEILKCHVE